ncbi:hypothetical protein [Chitinophaga sp. HK235]|uniref:hypothetical protein n=1 Tax=Chitinophaga sp. HK235 TaxID=2952571 RepID=UPI001BA59DD3|nr:hypothetical protein [Chitinophaga sp. HK235]
MSIALYSHHITPREIQQILSLGYELKGEITNAPEDFINKYFRNFDLLKLLDDINETLLSVSIDKLFKCIFLNPPHPPEIKIDIQSEHCENETSGLALSRTFTWDDNELIVKHDAFILPTGARNKGIAKKIFQSFLQQYLNMGVRKIHVFACLEDGGYVWAKFQFNALYKQEMTFILNNSRKKLTQKQYEAIEKIYNNYYIKHPEGKSFPIFKWAELSFMENILRSSQWHGAIDLSNREESINFITYVCG